MPKVIVERVKCIGCGSCVAICPKYFEIINDGKSTLKGGKINEKGDAEMDLEKIECTQEAADNCPVQCIHVE